MYGIYINLCCRFEFRTQKITLWKNFGQFFFNFTNFHAKKDHFSILAVIQNIWDLHKFGLQIWIQNAKITLQNAKITLWKNFGQFFRFHRFWSSGPGMQKKDNFSILAVFQNVWNLHKFWLQIWIQNTKNTLWKNFGQFSWFHQFWSFLNISCYFKIYGIYINLGCRFEFRTQKLPYERISGNFSNFTNFSHQVRVCKKRSFLNISCNSKYMGFT